MLVLTRRIGERILIGGGEITVELLGATDGRARLGISAPQAVPINREEVEIAMRIENAAALDEIEAAALEHVA